MMSATNCHLITFDSPRIDDREPREIYTEFSHYFQKVTQQDNQKLYINYREGCGKVYYTTTEPIQLLKEAIAQNNSLAIELGEVSQDSLAVTKAKRNHTDLSEMADKTCRIKKAVVDIFGTPVALVEDEDSNEYVRIDDAKRCGYQVFNSVEDAQNRIHAEIHAYLTSQAEMFLKMKSLPHKIDYLKIELKLDGQYQRTTAATASPARSMQGAQVLNGERNVRHRIADIQKPDNRQVLSPKANREENKENVHNLSNGNLNRSISKSSINSNESATHVNKKPASRRDMINKIQNVNKVQPPTPVAPSTPRGRLFIETLCPDEDVALEFISKISNTSFLGYIISFDETLLEAKIDVELLTVKVGDLVMVKLDKGRQSRGQVLRIQQDKYKVAALDYGEIVEVAEVFEVPKELRDACEYVIVCEASASFVKKVEDSGGLHIRAKNADTIIDVATGTLIKCTRWEPDAGSTAIASTPAAPQLLQKVEQQIHMSLPTAVIPLKVGEKVSLAGFDKGVLHLRTRATHTLITTMNAALNISGVDALDKPPKVGQYVLEKADKEWRRALVKSILPTGVSIDHVDYFQANAVVPPEQLFNLTPSAIFGPTLIKCHLRYFEDAEYPPNALAHMAKSEKKKLDVVYVEGDIIDLQTNDGKCLSEFLLGLDRPKAKTLADLPVLELKLNEEFSLVVVHVDEDDIVYFTPGFSDMKTIDDQMSELQEVNDLENVVEGQLCMAKFEDSWSRTVVKKINGNRVDILFIDFGNEETVNLEDLKELPEEFLKFSSSVLKGTLTQESLYYGNTSEICYKSFNAISRKKGGQLYDVQLILDTDP